MDRNRLVLRVDLLGPLAARVDGQEVAVPGARRRALLALLALAGDRGVGADRLVDGLWPDEPPDNATQALYNHVSRLRGHLGSQAERLQRYGAGYRLRLEPFELDVDAARRLAAGIRPDAPADRVEALAREALDLWRGPALEEFRALPSLESESVGLDELRLRLVDDLVSARLDRGDRTVVADATSAAAASPLRERTALLHVRALAADGRPGEAMAAAHAYRRRLAEETGLDPGPELADLEQRVAAGTLGPREPAGEAGRLRRVARPDGPLVGRGLDREEVVRLLGSHPVVTVTGPGGVGKTRLALDVAADPDAFGGARAEVAVADLAAVEQPDRVGAAVASTLGLRTSGPVGPADVAAALAERDLLLVLDNCEHLRDACRELVVTLRAGAPGVRVLATSRVTLQVPGEHVIRLQPLPVPRDVADLDALARQPAVRAFVEHARRRQPGFALDPEDAGHLLEVLRRLDGLPLGIELAARQVGLMPLRAVRERLDRTLDLATGRHGAEDERQHTLRATINSSYRLLDDDGRRLLRALAVFPGGADLATVEVLAADLGAPGDPLDLLHRLVDASLVVADAAAGRYRLLFTVRAFLLGELAAAGELDGAEERFLDRCLAVAREVELTMLGPDEERVDRRLRAELDNLRAARDAARARGRDDVLIGISLAVAEVTFWRDLREVWAWALELVDLVPESHPRRAAVLGTAAEGARLVGDLDRAERLALAAIELEGDGPGLAHRAWGARGVVAHFRGDFASARAWWVRSAERGSVGSGGYLGSAALAASYGGDPEGARDLLDRAHAAVAASGSISHRAFLAYVEGELLAVDRVEEAVPLFLEAIDEARRVGATFVEGVARVSLASARTRIGDVAAAAEGFVELLELWRRTGHSTQLWTTARNAAGLLAGAGRTRTSALLLLCADAAPAAAAVGPEIARFSGRTFTAVDRLVDDDELARLRTEASDRGASVVLDLAVAELRELAAGGAGPAAGR